MGLFSLSDVIISITLLVNAVALLASSIVEEPPIVSVNSRSYDSNNIHSLVEDENLKSEQAIGHTKESEPMHKSNMFRLYKVMNGIRRMSCLIVIWNIFFLILMVFVFRD